MIPRQCKSCSSRGAKRGPTRYNGIIDTGTHVTRRLEQALRNFSTLTPGDIIEISYNCLTFEILIMEVTPDADGIAIIETDLEVCCDDVQSSYISQYNC